MTLNKTVVKEIILHLIKTIQFRLDYAVSQADEQYPALSLGHGVRTPMEILHHIQGLMYYAIKICGGGVSQMPEPTDWFTEMENFKVSIGRLEDHIRNHDIDTAAYMRITQGPLADALTHIGQLATLSRVNGQPLPKLNYSKVDMDKELL